MSEQIPGYNTEVPADWEMTTVDQLATRVGSGMTPRGGSEVYKSEGVIFIRSQNVTFGGLDLSDVAFIDEKTHRLMQASEVFPFDVLLNITGASIGRCCFVPDGLGKANQNQHVCTIRLPDPGWADAKFLSVVLSSPIGQNQIIRLNAGGNREGLNYGQLRSFDVVWPPSPERLRIAEILSMVDEAIEQTDALIAKQHRIKTGLMQDLLTRGIDEHGRLRTEDTHEFKDSLIGRIPVEWDLTAVDEVAKITTGNKDTQDADDSAEYPFFVRSQTIERIGTYSLQGEAVLTAGDGVGTGKVFHYYNGKFDFHQRVYCIHSFTSGMLGYFFYSFFRVHFMARVAQFSAKGSVDSVRLHMIAKMLIPKPEPEEQARICDVLKTAEDSVSRYEDALKKLRSLKAGLMADLLTGTRRVTAFLENRRAVTA